MSYFLLVLTIPGIQNIYFKFQILVQIIAQINVQ